MSRVSFHESLEQIEMNLLSMGELAGTSVQRSVEALVQHDDARAQTVIDDDDTVDVHDDGSRTGTVVEFDRTESIFTNPADQRTEDYVTGRFG